MWISKAWVWPRYIWIIRTQNLYTRSCRKFCIRAVHVQTKKINRPNYAKKIKCRQKNGREGKKDRYIYIHMGKQVNTIWMEIKMEMRLFPWNRTVLLNVCHVPSSCHSGSTHIQTAAKQQKYGNNNCLLASKPSIHRASQQSASSMTITTTSSSDTIIKNEYKMVVFGV